MGAALLDDLTRVLDALVEHGAGELGDGASVEKLWHELTRLEAVVTEATAVFDASEEWSLDGARSSAAWLATRCHLPRAGVRRRVRLGRSLRHLPAATESWRAGRIGADHVQDLARAAARRTETAMRRDEELLVSYAEQMGFEDFHRALAYWKQLADPEGSDDAEAARRDRRDVWLEESISGMFLGQMTLDPVSGAVVTGELKRLEDALFEADCAAAAERLGRRANLDELARTSAQRRADALVEMATRSAAMQAEVAHPAPLFSILVGYETLHGRICELESGKATVLAPSALDPWLSSATFERVVFTPSDRIEVSAKARLFTGATRRAIEVRDRRCTHPCCDAPAERCQADHITPYAVGGETTQENGRLLCGFHNRLRNHLERSRPPPVGPGP